jgi:hypothetical protein
MLAPHPNFKLEVYPLSAVLDCLFNICVMFEDRSSIRNLRMRHAVVTGTQNSIKAPSPGGVTCFPLSSVRLTFLTKCTG